MGEMSNPSVRDTVATYLEREMELALRLADQTQQRAQAIASTLTLVISVVSVVLAVRPSVFARLNNGATEATALLSIGLLLVSLGLSLSVAVPKPIRLTHPTWYAEVLEKDIAYRPMGQQNIPAMMSVIQRLDHTYVAAYDRILRSNRFRGVTLSSALVSLGLGLLIGVYTALRLSGHL